MRSREIAPNVQHQSPITAKIWVVGYGVHLPLFILETFITLYKLTDQGIKNIKDAPGRIEDGIKGFESMGGKVIGFYSVMGEYDYVSIGECPSDEIVTTFALAVGSLGNARTTTLKAFSKEEFGEIVKRLP
jgi:uncharacterized protein with GYD domain